MWRGRCGPCTDYMIYFVSQLIQGSLGEPAIYNHRAMIINTESWPSSIHRLVNSMPPDGLHRMVSLSAMLVVENSAFPDGKLLTVSRVLQMRHKIIWRSEEWPNPCSYTSRITARTILYQIWLQISQAVKQCKIMPVFLSPLGVLQLSHHLQCGSTDDCVKDIDNECAICWNSGEWHQFIPCHMCLCWSIRWAAIVVVLVSTISINDV